MVSIIAGVYAILSIGTIFNAILYVLVAIPILVPAYALLTVSFNLVCRCTGGLRVRLK